MVMKMDRTSIALLAWQTVDQIKESPVYRAFLAAESALMGLDGPSELIAAFTMAKAKYEQTSTYGKNHPDFKRDAAALAAAKTALYETVEHKRYAACLRELDSILSDIAGDIAETLDSCLVSPQKHCITRR